ncbi:hypothetical protein [Ruminococcus sp. Marseille-P6503]|uniref:hypothetical protein n=1 Tax=Ruminococcus sp. Marseille-P6503 TaxID=2364796 RepID=UPI000F529C4D|nr:hypothetical protein [Ruminococcus sp. Marseille-P6503]
MDNTIISVVMLGVCLLIYASYIVYNKIIVPRRASKEETARKMSANTWTNVIDIDDAIYTRDGYIISVFRISPVNTELMTKREKAEFVKIVSGSLSSIRTPYKLLAVPQPFDVQPYLDNLNEQKRTGSNVRKLIISDEINYMNSMAASGTMVEKKFYIVTWSKAEDDYVKEREDFITHWNDSRKLETQLLSRQEIIQLCNLIFNPAVKDEIYDDPAFALPRIRK